MAYHPSGQSIFIGGGQISWSEWASAEGATFQWTRNKPTLKRYDTGYNDHIQLHPLGKLLLHGGVHECGDGFMDIDLCRGRFFLYDLNKDKRIPPYTKGLGLSLFHPSGHVVASLEGGKLQLRDVKTMTVLKEHDLALQSIVWSPDGKYIYAGKGQISTDRKSIKSTLLRIDPTTGKSTLALQGGNTAELHKWNISELDYLQLSIDRSGRYLAAVSLLELVLWDLQKKKVLWTKAHDPDTYPYDEFAHKTLFNANGTLLLKYEAGSVHLRGVRVWDVKTGTLHQKLLTKEEPLDIRLSPDGTEFAIATRNEVQLWSCAWCQPNERPCDGTCTDLRTNPKHCGACNNVCPSTKPTCQQGVCSP